MVYDSGRNGADRTKTVILVTALEAAVIYAVISGLAMKFNPPAPPPPVLATAVPKPLPEATPTPTPSSEHSPIVQPTVAPTITPIEPTAGPTTIPTSGPTAGPPYTGPTITPTADPAPQFEARAPRPRGRPGEWVTTNDYPAQDLREGNQGLVRVHLAVNAGGAATACTVTASSGFPRLDAAACARLVSRSRFEPATDTSGAKASGSFNTSVRWSIPRD